MHFFFLQHKRRYKRAVRVGDFIFLANAQYTQALKICEDNVLLLL